ncbi:MAG: SHOCT domain-containing protein [Leptospiraceae bacterium]|nr:SHOCT domain-containing protein [Leptospiraceae bacterium]MDW7975086.1 SHOCT domain-containing protein [Leptospiraceae bacterium]
MKVKLVAILVFVFFVSCASGFYKKKKIYTSDDLVIYFLDQSDYPDEKEIRAQLPPLLPIPENSIEILSFALSELKIEKKEIFGKNEYPLFYPEQLYEILAVFKDILPNVPEGKRLLVVQKYDPFKTLFSKEKRTTFMFWYDEFGYNLVVGESHEDLLMDSFSTKKDWLDFYPVSFKRNNPKLKIIKTDFFEYKQVGDFTHYTWITFQKDVVSQLIPKQKETSALDFPQVEEKLKRLKELYDKKLITKEEYDSKRKEILKNF